MCVIFLTLFTGGKKCLEKAQAYDNMKLRVYAGSIVDNKGMHVIFQNKGKKKLERAKKGKILENLGKNIQNLKIY